MTQLEIILSVLLGVSVVCNFVAIIVAVKRKKRMADSVRVVDGMRVPIEEDSEISLRKGDFILQKGETYKVQKSGADLLPGKYTVMSSVEGVQNISVRISGIVRSVRHNADIILSEGDTICPVSHTVVLR